MAFDLIDADSLEVWNVSVPIDEDANLEVQVKDLKVLETKSLLPVKSLSGTFQSVIEVDSRSIYMSLSALPQVSARPIFAYPHKITRS